VSEQPTSVSNPHPATRRRQVSGLARLGMVLFVIGLVAVAVILVLFATGTTELPLWVNLLAMLAPVGFGLGLLGVYSEARAARRAGAARRNAAATTAEASSQTVTG
jgi:hypothetical protein